jgi:hypothetical protein
VLPDEIIPVVIKADSKEDTPSRSWIKDVSAAVGVIAAAVGVIISIADLRMKSEADRQTAEINRAALQQKIEADRKVAEVALKSEDVKLKISESSLQ